MEEEYKDKRPWEIKVLDEMADKPDDYVITNREFRALHRYYEEKLLYIQAAIRKLVGAPVQRELVKWMEIYEDDR